MDNKISVLYIGESPESAEIIQHFQSSPDIELTVFANRLVVDNFLKKNAKPDVIFCEYDIMGGKTIDFHNDLRQNSTFDSVAFILLTHEFREKQFFEAFNNRIDDFYVLPLPPVEDLVDRIFSLKKYRESHRVILHDKIISDENDDFSASNDHIPLSKRIFDVVVAGSALIILSPLLLLVMIAIKIESPGKVYYTSVRIGRFGRKFNFYKFRSMRTGADADLKKLAVSNNQYTSSSQRTQIDYLEPCPKCGNGKDGKWCDRILSHIDERNNEIIEICSRWYEDQRKQIAIFIKISKDPRVTKVGKFIRNTSIDELPQLLNVLKGDMSIVGNRPLPQKEDDKIGQDGYLKRHLAPAGITGLWQVELRGRGGVMSELERIKLDNEYADFFIKNKYSFWYDMKLILRTFKALFQKDSV